MVGLSHPSGTNPGLREHRDTGSAETTGCPTLL